MIFRPIFYTKSRKEIAVEIAKYKRKWPNSVLVGRYPEYIEGDGYMTVVEFEDKNFW